MTRRGEYKIALQVGNWVSFAKIAVSLEPGSDQSRQVRVAASVDTWNRDWIEAATRACARCLELFRLHGIADSNTTIVLEDLRGMVVDTTDDAIEAAAVMAVAHAFELCDEFSLKRADRWHVEWPAMHETVV
jgi:hypothetical protein